MVNKVRARIAAVVVVVVALFGMVMSHTAFADDMTIQTDCGDAMHPTVNGGEAYWKAVCSGSVITIEGWVKDTAPDGQCARVKALFPTVTKYSQRACPSGTTQTFSLSAVGTYAHVFLYLEDT